MGKDSLNMTYDLDVKRAAETKRLYNIKTFSSLDRSGLCFGKVERRLTVYKTNNGEEVSVQYPGKEISRGNLWDFRPKLYMSATDSFLPDLSFHDIWDDLAAIHTNDHEALQILSAILFRMAFMVGYVKNIRVCDYEDIDVSNRRVLKTGKISLEIYEPEFDTVIIDLEKAIGHIRGVSLLAYLLYNDLLAQNEDCKYYFRDTYVKGGSWASNTGRRNTLLTHLSVIEYIQGDITFSQIMNRFQSGRGVAPIKLKSIASITGGIINKKE